MHISLSGLEHSPSTGEDTPKGRRSPRIGVGVATDAGMYNSPQHDIVNRSVLLSAVHMQGPGADRCDTCITGDYTTHKMTLHRKEMSAPQTSEWTASRGRLRWAPREQRRQACCSAK